MTKLLDHYHPERHYMRGPGPKWHERNGHADRTDLARSDCGASLRKWMLARLTALKVRSPCRIDGPGVRTHALMDASPGKHLKIILVAVIAAIAVAAAISAQL
jgi:hypothetical protein